MEKEKTINKDFYRILPGIVCVALDELINKYADKRWFNKAWGEYRQHVRESSMDNVKMPIYIFGKYLKTNQ